VLPDCVLPFPPDAHIFGANGGGAGIIVNVMGQVIHLTVGVDKISRLRQAGFSNDEIYSIVAPRRTLERRKANNELLTLAESDRALRLERISEHADRVFGSHEKAQRWLRKESRVLGERPINLLVSETGAHLVEEELHRIDHGMFA
jgi:putative toxin-antitoxin system antitoxin component (TIGR02293 family)